MVDAQQNLFISIGTGGERIQNADAKYQRHRRALIAAPRARGIDPPFPWDGLWGWYGYYSAELGTHAERGSTYDDWPRLLGMLSRLRPPEGTVADPGP
jgi:hypothetical protein